MKRNNIYRPTIEDTVELSGIETLHPGGLPLTRRTAEVAQLAPGLRVLDVSSGRGTQALLYATEYGVDLTGIDIAHEMVTTARNRTRAANLSDRVRFVQGDSQALPFADAEFDVVINECAVGIPDDSQRVLDEMVRVVKPGGRIVIHESTWRQAITSEEKEELTERYGTTPLEEDEWVNMLERAGAMDVNREVERWSKPENFWQIRQERHVARPGAVLTLREQLKTAGRILGRYGLKGLATAWRNEKLFFEAIRAGKIGYGLFWATKPSFKGSGNEQSSDR